MQKPWIIHNWILLFFNSGSCFTNGTVVHMDWRWIGFKSMGIWKMLRYKSGHQMIIGHRQFCDFISRQYDRESIRGVNQRLTWHPIRIWIEYWLDTQLVANSSVYQRQTWFPINGRRFDQHAYPNLLIWHPIVLKFVCEREGDFVRESKTDLAENSVTYSDLSNISGVSNKHMEVCKFFSLLHNIAR